jgi:hypothetical protein
MISLTKIANPFEKGLCSLTRIYGVFVRSHIIPRSLTRLTSSNERLVEVSIGKGSKRRYDSWFDSSLVISEGEKILENIDTPAIQLLRKHKMLWSSWPGIKKLVTADMTGDAESVNFRKIIFEDAAILQLFFISLVWRAAASSRVEMCDVILDPDILEDMRLRVLNQNIGNNYDYPIHLHQITTLGVEHNRTPLLEKVKISLSNGSESDQIVDRVRIYFDGLIAHVYIFKNIPKNDSYISLSLGNGIEKSTIIFGQPFSSSRAKENIKTLSGNIHSVYKKQRNKKKNK